MRILYVTPYVPSRIRVRPFNLIKMLSQTHDVALVSLVADDYERALVKDIEPYCASIDLVELRKRSAYARCLLALPTSMPLRVAYYRSPEFARRIKAVVSRQKIDVAHGELIKVVPVLKAALEGEGIPALFDSVDCISSYLRQTLETTRNPVKRTFIYTELLKMRRYEQKSLADFDQVVISSASDREHLGELTGLLRKIEVVSNGVDSDYFSTSSDTRITDTLVFCAKLDYFPNAQAILHFCEHILPLIWRERPRVRLSIVGNNPPRVVRALALDARITVTGYVPDIRPYLNKTAVAIAPLLVAAGTQFKVLEALSMSAPVVTTPRCAAALGAENGVHLLAAEAGESQVFADAVIRLLEDQEYAAQLGRAGRQFVLERYNWAGSAGTLNRLYEAIALPPVQQEAQALMRVRETSVWE